MEKKALNKNIISEHTVFFFIYTHHIHVAKYFFRIPPIVQSVMYILKGLLVLRYDSED